MFTKTKTILKFLIYVHPKSLKTLKIEMLTFGNEHFKAWTTAYKKIVHDFHKGNSDLVGI